MVVKKIWKYGVSGLLILLVIIIVVFRIMGDAKTADSRRQATPLVKVEKPLFEVIQQQLQYNGDVMPIQQAGIFSKVSGNLERIYSDMGSSVRANQLIATIDSTELYQQYQQTFATYQNTLLTYNRAKRLVEKDLVSEQDINNAETAMKVAKANYDAAATRLSYARIVAPFSGIITKRFLDPGTLVTANNATLFTLMDLDRVKITVNIPEKDVSFVYKVRNARITLDALPGKEFEGRVTLFSDAVDLTTRTMDVQVEVVNKDHLIKPGMFATVQMTVAERQNAITIPTNAILKDDAGQYVFALDGSSAKCIRVKTGVELLERTEILSGLTGNETVITVGQQFVKDGGQVIIQH
jgi:membrane fusion protein (multidrug efflux system)